MFNRRIRSNRYRCNIPVTTWNLDCKVSCLCIRFSTSTSSVVVFCRAVEQSLYISTRNFLCSIIYGVIFPYIVVSHKLSFCIRSPFSFCVLISFWSNFAGIFEISYEPLRFIFFSCTLNCHIDNTAFSYRNVKGSVS